MKGRNIQKPAIKKDDLKQMKLQSKAQGSRLITLALLISSLVALSCLLTCVFLCIQLLLYVALTLSIYFFQDKLFSLFYFFACIKLFK